MSFHKAHEELMSLGIDDVIAVNSFENLFGIWADHQSQRIKALPNVDAKFVQALAQYYDIDKPVRDLANVWQYITVINNGVPEKLWHNPFKTDMKLRAIKTEMYQYRKLTVDSVLDYLKNSVDTEK
jgi:peroxiredoxin